MELHLQVSEHVLFISNSQLHQPRRFEFYVGNAEDLLRAKKMGIHFVNFPICRSLSEGVTSVLLVKSDMKLC